MVEEGVSVVMSVMSSPPDFCKQSARTLVKLCSLCVFALGLSLVF